MFTFIMIVLCFLCFKYIFKICFALLVLIFHILTLGMFWGGGDDFS